ncbi:MAG: RDD family protein [Bacilli bacterium]|nr:RDD family protein [Bacilli bacterium]
MRKRILAMIIDYFILLLFLEIIIYLYSYFNNIDPLFLHNDIEIVIALLMLTLKDLIFKNKSIGKKIMGIEVRYNDNKIPSFPILILRNITVIIWPIECLLILLKKNRIGDIIFKTKIVLTDNVNNISN